MTTPSETGDGPRPGPNPDRSRNRSRNRILAVAALVGITVIAVVVAIVAVSDDDQASAQDRQVLLESTASAGPAPFTPDLQATTATTTVLPTSTTTSTTPATTTGRTAQGPFGGTGDNSLCDRELLVSFLTDPANAPVAREWARVIGITVADIPGYVRALIPTTLTSDTQVTNHRWENGRAVGYQAVLQAGTAVLVDTKGNLVARCRCGNPLRPPQPVSRPVYTGPRWPGFDPTVIVVVVASPTPIYPPGGVGTLPTTSGPRTTTTLPRGTTTTTLGPRSAEEAVRRIRNAFESCLRSGSTSSAGYLTGADLTQVLASATYTPTLVDAASATYRVVLEIPAQTLSDGITITGGAATWDLSLRTGEVTPIDANAQEVAAECPALA